MFTNLLTIAACFEDSNGYGYFTNNIIRHMIRAGVKVKLTRLFGYNPPADLMPYVNTGPTPKVHDITFTSISNNPTDIHGKLLFTMSETMDVPWEYGYQLQRYKHLVVPSQYSADACAQWHKRVSICPLGASMKWSPIVYKPFVFTAVAADHMCPERKRIQELADTFSKVFPREEDVRLQLKRTPNCAKVHTFDRRVEVVTARLDRPTYEDLMSKTTVGVQVSAMEGWGLPVNEFMALGRPVVTPRAGAIRDFMPAEACFEVSTTRRRAPRAVFLGKGMINYASMKDLGRQMRFAYDNPLEVARRGLKAHEASAPYTIHAMGQRFLDLCQTILT